MQTAPAHTCGGPRDPGTPSLGRAAVAATAVCLQAPSGTGAPALALWLLPRAPGSAPQPDGPASLRVPRCPHRRPHLQPLCFLAAPTWKWPGSEPPRLVSKCPAFSCWSVCICSGSGQTLWPQPDGQGGARGSASLLFWGLLAFASLGSLLGLTVSFLGALVGLTCRSTSLPAALSPLLGAGLAWPPSWVSLLPPRVLRPQ